MQYYYPRLVLQAAVLMTSQVNDLLRHFSSMANRDPDLKAAEARVVLQDSALLLSNIKFQYYTN